MLELKNYQEDAVSNIEAKIDKWLRSESTQKLCVLKAPTGSGKTVMMAELIKRLVDNSENSKELAFIWIAVRRLHSQSKEKLENYYDNSQSVNCSYFEDLQDKQIQDGEVLFFNWSSINQKDNIYIRDNENEFNLSSVVQNTKNAGREIILVIDESHHTARGRQSKKVIDKIQPKITINVSATPKSPNPNHIEEVEVEKVKDEGMVKKSIMINNSDLETLQTSPNKWIIQTALDKRQELQKHYKQANSEVNPLVLIQIPDNKPGLTNMQGSVIQMLSKHNISLDNCKLAIYLSDNQTNLENIQKHDNEVEVLIFKQAIALGWDCPRASILVLFREWREFEFSIQTIGRILRMPETKHYDNNVLDNAYVYTNVKKIDIIQDVAKDYVVIHTSKRNDSLYDVLDLPSVYIKRRHEMTRLTGKFASIFDRVSKEKKLVSHIKKNPEDIYQDILLNGKIENLDQEQEVEGRVVPAISNSDYIQQRFNMFVWESSSGFAPIRSSKIIRTTLYKFFSPLTENWNDVQKLILMKGNQTLFLDAINRAKELYRKEIVDRAKREIEHIPKWNVPETVEHTKLYEEKKYEKCVMSPMYVETLRVKNEDRFMDFIDERGNVKWWFKNGQGDKKYFAVQYTDLNDGLPHPFYVDFIVYTNDGRIGLFDTKEGFTARDSDVKQKAEALTAYIKSAKNMFGGIAIFDNGEWMYNDQDKYHYDPNDLSDWKPILLD